MNNLLTGNQGENLAEGYLNRRGYSIVERNFQCKIGEIDLIARRQEVLHFIEVKTRTSDSFGLPLEAISEAKKRKICRTAQYYLLKNPKWQRYEKVFSVVSIENPSEDMKIEFFENAFEYVGDTF